MGIFQYFLILGRQHYTVILELLFFAEILPYNAKFWYTGKQWYITQQLTARANLFLE